MKRIASVALMIIFLVCGAESALADTAAATTMKLEAVTGTVTVKNASGMAQTVRAGMRLYNGYTLSTAAASEAYISLDSSKAVKLGASGKAQIKQSGKRLEVSVSAGELFFNVTAPLGQTRRNGSHARLRYPDAPGRGRRGDAFQRTARPRRRKAFRHYRGGHSDACRPRNAGQS